MIEDVPFAAPLTSHKGDEWSIVIRSPTEPITSNQRLHHMARARRVKEWREAAAWHARAARLPPIGRARIVVTISFTNARRRDVGNWQPTAKAVVDGLVDAGVLADDDDTHVEGPDLRRGVQTRGPVPVLTVTLTDLGRPVVLKAAGDMPLDFGTDPLTGDGPKDHQPWAADVVGGGG